MGPADITFTNVLGQFLAPFLIFLRSTGFFEAYVFMPVMTALSIPLFVWLARKLARNGTFDGPAARFKKLWLAAYYGICFLITNVTAVAFKTLMVEELDYTSRVWFEAYVGPMHFYILSVCIAYVWMILRNSRTPLDVGLIGYIQIGLIGGYSVGIYRLLYEPFSILDVTTGISGIFLGAYFLLYNFDLYGRLSASSGSKSAAPRAA